jgi:hypothetical protein
MMKHTQNLMKMVDTLKANGNNVQYVDNGALVNEYLYFETGATIQIYDYNTKTVVAKYKTPKSALNFLTK